MRESIAKRYVWRGEKLDFYLEISFGRGISGRITATDKMGRLLESKEFEVSEETVRSWIVQTFGRTLRSILLGRVSR